MQRVAVFLPSFALFAIFTLQKYPYFYPYFLTNVKISNKSLEQSGFRAYFCSVKQEIITN